ncbi:recombinase family protein [Cohnella soli]|uniref:Recombinase family protein n=1 Tax=Cohnella soli TaxID=425005 RepID=A0ABW0HX05_9BACL
MESKQIKHVAVYLRKSRDEGEFDDVLSKHRDTLLALVNNRNWSYRLYEEVASGEKIESRKEMQKLLRHVEDKMYDGVVVMDIDRLGRGENKDWALIKDTFLYSETVIITPNKIFDLEEDNDDVSFDFMSIFARLEYKTIKRRMRQGKEAGARKGMWTSGRPPFPYYYDKNTRSLAVDETNRPIYRAIIEKYLNDENLIDIAIWLTNNKIPTPYKIKPNGKDKGWSHVTVRRLLKSDVHLGYITFGKTRTKRGQVEIVPDEERIRAMGNHEKLKTPEEHEKIIERLTKNKLINPNARRNVLPLSGLVVCEKCGHRMQLRVGYGKGKGKYWTLLCNYVYKDGSKCEQKGKQLNDDFYNALFERIIHVDPQILKEIEIHGVRFNDTKVIIEVKEQDLNKQKRALEKLYESYEESVITKQEFVERKELRVRQIHGLEEEIHELRRTLENKDNFPTITSMYKRIDKFQEIWNGAVTNEEKNKALKQLVERIVYDRDEDRIELTVCYK